MFKFNFNVEENSKNDNSNVENDDICSLNQEAGCFYIDDLQSIVMCEGIKMSRFNSQNG
jgi:hypothetical protein